MKDADRLRDREHVLKELGFVVERAGNGLRGTASIVPEMWVPGTEALRTSILATWADTITGLLAVELFDRRVPVTLELDVHLYRPAVGIGRVHATGRTLKAGRAVAVGTVDFTDEAGAPVATGTATFMAAPDPELRMPAGSWHLDAVAERGGPLEEPLAERIGCERRDGGVAVLPMSDDSLNASGTVNGGLLAVVTEEAALAAAPPGTTLASIGMRYLRPVRRGPAVARAVVHVGVGRVEVDDEGRDSALAVVATTRSWPA